LLSAVNLSSCLCFHLLPFRLQKLPFLLPSLAVILFFSYPFLFGRIGGLGARLVFSPALFLFPCGVTITCLEFSVGCERGSRLWCSFPLTNRPRTPSSPPVLATLMSSEKPWFSGLLEVAWVWRIPTSTHAASRTVYSRQDPFTPLPPEMHQSIFFMFPYNDTLPPPQNVTPLDYSLSLLEGYLWTDHK